MNSNTLFKTGFLSLGLMMSVYAKASGGEGHNDLLDLKKEILQDECSSGERIGIKTSINPVASNAEKGGSLQSIFTKLSSPKTYTRSVNGVPTIVTDNVYFDDLSVKYPELIEGRIDGLIIKEKIPTIKNFEYKTDEFGEPVTPLRTWRYDFFGRHGNQRLLVTDNPLKVTKNAQGKVIKTEAQDSPKIMRAFEFFPRKNVAGAELVQEGAAQLIRMTLPTGEAVDFEAETGKLIGGAFTASNRTVAEYKKGQYLYNPTNFKYTGTGVWIEMVEEESIGDSRSSVSKKNLKNMVNVYKNNPFRSCKVASEDLWENKAGLRSNSEEFLTFAKAKGEVNPSQWGHLNTSYSCFFLKYKTDEELDKFLKQKCGFGFLE